MKNKLLALLATLSMVASASAVKINNNLSINGFVDGSWSNSDTDGNDHDNQSLGLDEVELNFIVNAGSVSGELHIDSNNTNPAGGAFDVIAIEQVHFSYNFSNGVTAQVGRFGSELGLEREDPAGLYTFSRAYTNTDFQLGNIDAYRHEGIRLSYSADTLSFSVAAFNDVNAIEESNAVNGREDNLDYEFAVGFSGFEGLSLSAGIIQRNGEDNDLSDPANAVVDTTITNLTASYTFNKILFLAEYTTVDEDSEPELSAYSLIADYDINEKLGIAVRYSEEETTATTETDSLTIAPNYAITSSLGAILEYTASEVGNNDSDLIAVEGRHFHPQ